MEYRIAYVCFLAENGLDRSVADVRKVPKAEVMFTTDNGIHPCQRGTARCRHVRPQTRRRTGIVTPFYFGSRHRENSIFYVRPDLRLVARREFGESCKLVGDSFPCWLIFKLKRTGIEFGLSKANLGSDTDRLVWG
jgi:hypothetical protein